MKFYVILEAESDGGYSAECPQLPGCVSQGDTREEALANISGAIAALMELRIEENWPALPEVVELDIEIPALHPVA